jgi:hypothetical protein
LAAVPIVERTPVPIVERRCATLPRAPKGNRWKPFCRKFGCESNAVLRFDIAVVVVEIYGIDD